jgi:hypothetical protein
MAAFLPSRYWAAFEHRLPVTSSAALSGVVTFMVGGVLGIAGFLRYAAAQASALNTVTLKVAERQLSQPPGGSEISSTTPVFVNAIAPIAFLFFTPLGVGCLYLAVSGAVRAISNLVDDPLGDPILTAGDIALRAAASTTRSRRDRRRRFEAEGPEIPDRAVSGKAAGIPDADLVIVSSRRKDGWTAGVIVITADKWYRLGEPIERTVEGRLRTLYPLKEHRDLEVARRTVRYELPGAVR